MITVTLEDSGEELKLDPCWIEKIYREKESNNVTIRIKQQLNGIPPLKIPVRDTCQRIRGRIKEHYHELQVDLFREQ